MTQIIQVPIEDLAITKTNARKDHSVDQALVASIRSVGLLYPLTVEKMEDGKYDVIDGAQRLLALRDLAMQGIRPNEGRVPCQLRNGEDREGIDGLEISLHANLRTPMHPLDECEAIVELSKRGEQAEDIAMRFGKDVKWLEQRVKLADLAPEVKKLFRDGKIGLNAAMVFTLGSVEQQRAFLKRHKDHDFTFGQLMAAMTEKKIAGRYANFDLALYPQDKIQRDLFAVGDDDDGIWLLDRKKFDELQDEWAAGEVQRLKDLGYDKVEILEQSDWQTLNQYVELEGKAKPKNAEQRALCSAFLKADHFGHITVYENMARRKDIEKAEVKKSKTGAATDSAETPPKPMKASELNPIQQEILNGLLGTALFNKVSSGKADEKLVQWLVVANQFGRSPWIDGGVSSNAFKHNGTRARWDKLQEAYPSEPFVEQDKAFDNSLDKGLSYAEFIARPAAERRKLFNHAVASMIFAPHRELAFKPGDPLMEGLDWLRPSRDFFKRFRTDQLIDYKKRSGDKEVGKLYTPAKSKDAHITDCLSVAGTKDAYDFGLLKAKK